MYSDELVRTLRIGASWVAEARLANQPDEVDQACEAFLRLAEIVCERGLHSEQIQIDAGTAIDGPTLRKLVQSVRPAFPRFEIRLIQNT